MQELVSGAPQLVVLTSVVPYRICWWRIAINNRVAETIFSRVPRWFVGIGLVIGMMLFCLVICRL